MKILLQTTIPPIEDDWSIARFSRLADLLRSAGHEVTARDRGPVDAPDPILSTLDASGFDQLWLFGTDTGDGLTPDDCEGIARFHETGGNLLLTRDHMDLGCSLCGLGPLGALHFFHSHNPHPDPATHVRDDPDTVPISWPNYHSGANGDFQQVEPALPLHPILLDPDSPTGAIRHLPSHPHEGGVRVPEGAAARVIASGCSQATGNCFAIAIASTGGPSRVVAQSTFHHFADYNWDVREGCPSFLSEPPGDALRRNPQAWADTQRYMLNLAEWLGGRHM